MAGLIFGLIIAITAAIMLLTSSSDTRTRFFWISFGYLLFSELMLGLSFTDIAGSGSQKGMPFKVAQGLVSIAYFLFTLTLALLAKNFDSVAAYSITQMIPAFGVSIFTIALAAAQYARRSSDDAAASGRATKVEINVLLADLVANVKELPFRNELTLVLSGLDRCLENVRYMAEAVSGAEQADWLVMQQIGCLAEQIQKAGQVLVSDRAMVVERIQSDVRKLEHLLKQREFSIKQLR